MESSFKSRLASYVHMGLVHPDAAEFLQEAHGREIQEEVRRSARFIECFAQKVIEEGRQPNLNPNDYQIED